MVSKLAGTGSRKKKSPVVHTVDELFLAFTFTVNLM